MRLSIAAANRDPDVLAAPDRFALHREDRRHLAFAPWTACVCRRASRTARGPDRLAALLARFPRLRLDPERRTPVVRGLVFRTPVTLDVVCG